MSPPPVACCMPPALDIASCACCCMPFILSMKPILGYLRFAVVLEREVSVRAALTQLQRRWTVRITAGGRSAHGSVERREPLGRYAGEVEPADHHPRRDRAPQPDPLPAPRRGDGRAGQADRAPAPLEAPHEVVVVHDPEVPVAAQGLERPASDPDGRVAVVDPEPALHR